MLNLSAFFQERISPEPNTGCWLWTGNMTSSGYGRHYGHSGRYVTTHRVLYEIANGAVPEGLDLDHLCRTRACVNPDHLEPVTRAENLRRSPLVGHVRPEQTHCKSGHPLSGNNLRIDKASGWRKCRACSANWSRAYQARKAS